MQQPKFKHGFVGDKFVTRRVLENSFFGTAKHINIYLMQLQRFKHGFEVTRLGSSDNATELQSIIALRP
eukprot:SAG31_NODE_18680_length_627_cov_0.482955_1_plen_68_part_10